LLHEKERNDRNGENVPILFENIESGRQQFDQDLRTTQDQRYYDFDSIMTTVGFLEHWLGYARSVRSEYVGQRAFFRAAISTDSAACTVHACRIRPAPTSRGALMSMAYRVSAASFAGPRETHNILSARLGTDPRTGGALDRRGGDAAYDGTAPPRRPFCRGVPAFPWIRFGKRKWDHVAVRPVPMVMTRSGCPSESPRSRKGNKNAPCGWPAPICKTAATLWAYESRPWSHCGQ